MGSSHRRTRVAEAPASVPFTRARSVFHLPASRRRVHGQLCGGGGGTGGDVRGDWGGDAVHVGVAVLPFEPAGLDARTDGKPCDGKLTRRIPKQQSAEEARPTPRITVHCR